MPLMTHDVYQKAFDRLVDISRLIRSRAGGRDEERRGLCYDQHRVWTVTVNLPNKLPCVLWEVLSGKTSV